MLGNLQQTQTSLSFISVAVICTQENESYDQHRKPANLTFSQQAMAIMVTNVTPLKTKLYLQVSIRCKTLIIYPNGKL